MRDEGVHFLLRGRSLDQNAAMLSTFRYSIDHVALPVPGAAKAEVEREGIGGDDGFTFDFVLLQGGGLICWIAILLGIGTVRLEGGLVEGHFR